MEKRRVIFVMSGKGGVGKSTYTYNVANILQREEKLGYYFDLDNDNETSIKQLKFVDATMYDLIDPSTDLIDKSLFTAYLDDICELEGEGIVVNDCGSETSKQLMKFLSSKVGQAIMKDFAEELDFEFHCVVEAKNSYPSCVSYLERLLPVTKGIGKTFICCNDRYPYPQEHIDEIMAFADQYSSQIIRFSIVIENPVSVVEQIKENMFHGVASYNRGRRSVRKYYEMTLDEMHFPV